MQVVNVQQNTSQWLEERKKFIGGSDAPIVMGVSPWKTPLQLWEEKTGKTSGEDKSKEWLFKKGHRLEDRARKLFELLTGNDFPPAVVQHAESEFCRVSLDGYCEKTSEIAEIKYVGEKLFGECELNNTVPEHYMPQLQYQMYATGIESNWFVAYSEKQDKIHSFKVEADPEYILKMITECQKFHKLVLTDKAPELSDKDYLNVRNKELLGAMAHYVGLDEVLKETQNQMTLVKETINKLKEEKHPNAKRFRGAGLIVYTTNRKGTTDWKKLCKDERISPEKIKEYEKPSTTSTTFKVGKQDEKTGKA